MAVETKSRPGGLEQERDRRAGDLAGRLADRGARVVGPRQYPRHAADRAHPARLIAQHVVGAPQVALVALAFELGGEHAREHQEQLLVGVRERRDRVPERGQRADPRAVGQLERHAQIGARADALLHRQRRVDRVAANVVAHARRAILGHVRAEGVAERDREVRPQSDARTVAGVDDAMDELRPVEVREEEHGFGQVMLEQVEHRAGRVGERAVRRRRRSGRRLDRARVHGGHCRRSPQDLKSAIRLVDSSAGSAGRLRSPVRGCRCTASASMLVARDRMLGAGRRGRGPPEPVEPGDGPQLAPGHLHRPGPQRAARRRGPRRGGRELRQRHRAGPPGVGRPLAGGRAGVPARRGDAARAVLRPRAIFGIGRNYAAHAAELGNVLPTAPWCS